MYIDVDYYRHPEGSKGIGWIEHVRLTEEMIIEYAKQVVENVHGSNMGYENHLFSIDKIVCD